MEVVERARAIALGLKRYFTGKPCKHGHVSERSVGNRECVTCSLERARRDPNKAQRTKQSAERNRAKRNQDARDRYWSNPEERREYNRQWRLGRIDEARAEEARERERSKERRRLYARSRYQTNRVAVRAATQKWESSNRPRVAEKTARRKSAKLRATPSWVSHDEIGQFYLKAKEASEMTGVPHEVDHIHPLQGVNFCGLHVPWNLQILSKSENSRKRNKLLDRELGWESAA